MIEKLNPTVRGIQPSPIRRITQEAREIPDCVFLTIGEPDGTVPLPLKEDICASLMADATHYPPNIGEQGLRTAIAAHINARHHAAYSHKNVLITCGSTEAIACALFSIVTPGDEVIVPLPAFGLYDTLLRLCGGVMRPLPTQENDFQIDEAALRALITPRTKAILLASPNNPTGRLYNAASLRAMKSAALAHDLFILLDSVYDELVYVDHPPHLMDDPEVRDRLIYLQSFSKPYAMTGVRIGYALADTPIIREMVKVHAAFTVGVPTFVQRGCENIFALDLAPVRALYRARRDRVCSRLRAMGLPVADPEGAFYVFPDVRAFGMDADTFCSRLLHEKKLALLPSSCFGAEGHVRISYCYSDAQLDTGMDRLEAFIHSL